MISRHLQIIATLLLASLFLGGIYMYYLKRRDEQNLSRANQASPLAAPAAGKAATVTLTLAYDDDQVLSGRDVEVVLSPDPSTRVRDLLRALFAEYLHKPTPHAIGEGSKVNAAYLLEDGICVIDLNAAFAEKHRSGILVEQFTIVSMVQTLAGNIPEIRRVKFLVDGKERQTLAGHADLSTVYDVSAMRELASQLERR